MTLTGPKEKFLHFNKNLNSGPLGNVMKGGIQI